MKKSRTNPGTILPKKLGRDGICSLLPTTTQEVRRGGFLPTWSGLKTWKGNCDERDHTALIDGKTQAQVDAWFSVSKAASDAGWIED